MKVEFAQLFTQVVSFILVLWVLKRYAWKPFLNLLQERENKIRDEFASIDKGKEENAALKLTYENQLKKASEEASEVIKKARDRGLEVAGQIEKKAHEAAEKILIQAQEELKNEVRKAKRDLKGELVKMTISASEKLLKTNMDQEKQKSLVREFIDQIGAS